MSSLNSDLKKKRDAKYDVHLENEVCQWVADITRADSRVGEGPESVVQWLQSGETLCQLANLLRPGAIPKYNVKCSTVMKFKQMENISIFLRACRDLGVQEKDLFSTLDLYEGKDVNAVILGLWNLGGTVQSTCPDFDGPKLGIRQHISDSPKKGGNANRGILVPTQPFIRTPTKPDASPSSPSNWRRGMSPVISTDAPAGPPMATWNPVAARETATTRFTAPPVATSRPEDDARRLLPAENTDEEIERVVLQWVVLVAGEERPEGRSTLDWLRSGEVLCRLMNVIRSPRWGATGAAAGSIRNVASATDPAMHQRDNMKRFVDSCRLLGVHEKDVFTSPDLFEGKSVRTAINCVYTLGGVLQSHEWWCGPLLGKRQQIALTR